jgi:hypothetical protein
MGDGQTIAHFYLFLPAFLFIPMVIWYYFLRFQDACIIHQPDTTFEKGI